MARAESDPYERAKAHALRVLKTRARSRAELIGALESKGFAPGIAARVADDFTRLGYLNERAFADDAIRAVTRGGPAARELLEQRLERHAVDRPAAEAALDEALAGRAVFDDALALATQRLRSMPAALDEPGKARRLMGVLARRGFDEETSAEAVRRLLPGVLDADEG